MTEVTLTVTLYRDEFWNPLTRFQDEMTRGDLLGVEIEAALERTWRDFPRPKWTVGGIVIEEVRYHDDDGVF